MPRLTTMATQWCRNNSYDEIITEHTSRPCPTPGPCPPLPWGPCAEGPPPYPLPVCPRALFGLACQGRKSIPPD